jgi:hypothetical protein
MTLLSIHTYRLDDWPSNRLIVVHRYWEATRSSPYLHKVDGIVTCRRFGQSECNSTTNIGTIDILITQVYSKGDTEHLHPASS